MRVALDAAAPAVRVARNFDNPSLLDIFLGNSTTADESIDFSSVARIEITGTNVASTITIDSSHGAVSVPEGIIVDGGTGANVLKLDRGSSPMISVGAGPVAADGTRTLLATVDGLLQKVTFKNVDDH